MQAGIRGGMRMSFYCKKAISSEIVITQQSKRAGPSASSAMCPACRLYDAPSIGFPVSYNSRQYSSRSIVFRASHMLLLLNRCL